MSSFILFDNKIDKKYFEPSSVNGTTFDPQMLYIAVEPLSCKMTELLQEKEEIIFNALIEYSTIFIHDNKMQKTEKMIAALAVRLFCVLSFVLKMHGIISCILHPYYMEHISYIGALCNVTYRYSYKYYKFDDKNFNEVNEIVNNDNNPFNILPINKILH